MNNKYNKLNNLPVKLTMDSVWNNISKDPVE